MGASSRQSREETVAFENRRGKVIPIALGRREFAEESHITEDDSTDTDVPVSRRQAQTQVKDMLYDEPVEDKECESGPAGGNRDCKC